MNNSTPHRFPPAVTPLWTTADLSRYLRITERGIYEMRKAGLPSIKVGHLVRFEEAAVRAWLAKNTGSSAADDRAEQLAQLVSEGGDAAECAASDSFKEFPQPRRRLTALHTDFAPRAVLAVSRSGDPNTHGHQTKTNQDHDPDKKIQVVRTLPGILGPSRVR